LTKIRKVTFDSRKNRFHISLPHAQLNLGNTGKLHSKSDSYYDQQTTK